MKKTLSFLLVILVTALFAGCPATPETNTNANTNAAAPAGDVSSTIIDLDKKAGEAWMKKDVKFFDGMLAANFVMNGAGGLGDKAMALKLMESLKCEIKSTSTSDQKVTELGDGVAVLTGKNTTDGTCDGEKIPAEEYFGSLYVKDGDNWKAAYYQSVAVAPKDGDKPDEAANSEEKKPAADEAAKEEEKPADGGEAKKEEEEPPMKPNIPNDEELAKKLTETETGLWEAWAKKDTKPFEAVLADKFIETNAKGMMDRAATLKDIAENKCDVKSSSISEGKATKVNDNIVIFTYTGKAAGTCDGNAMPDVPIYTTTIWQKVGEDWKAVFHMSTPGMKA
ncbi:MAG: nuclear transport factor 2 family protein [Acidobacteriota bacterium]|nr:nuclear transport factor 2 family protein [Acidobacteriota bacterium]MDH3530193.1 nuclear transport factor 2 family protein [Acidobacteriota bacterium]